jgi:hypothetical protein
MTRIKIQQQPINEIKPYQKEVIRNRFSNNIHLKWILYDEEEDPNESIPGHIYFKKFIGVRDEVESPGHTFWLDNNLKEE